MHKIYIIAYLETMTREYLRKFVGSYNSYLIKSIKHTTSRIEVHTNTYHIADSLEDSPNIY